MEIEAKFIIPDDDTWKQLYTASQLGRFSLAATDQPPYHVQDIYLDTPSRSIYQHGYACRVRRRGEQCTLTLKGLGAAQDAIHQRAEIEFELTNPLTADPRTWPDIPERQMVLSWLAEQPLEHLFTIEQTRYKRDLYDRQRLVAQVYMDQVCIRAGESSRDWQELEAELTPTGSLDDLLRLARRLGKTYHLRPDLLSKFHHGLELLDAGQPGQPTALPEPPKSISSDEPIDQVGRRIIHLHWTRMLNCQAGARSGEDIETLHDMRVAIRRMRAALRIFAPFFSKREIRPLMTGLRQTAQILGAVRDLDVLLDQAQRYIAGRPPNHANDLDLLFATWQAQRQQARQNMLAYLDGQDYQKLVSDLRVFALPNPPRRKRKRPSVREAAPPMIYARWERVMSWSDHLPGASLAELHALRIECKYLRYTCEFFQPALGPTAKEVILQVIALQDHLGELHDADVSNHLLSGLLFPPGATTAIMAPGVLEYLAAGQRRLQALRQDVPARWQALQQDQVRRRLEEALAAL